MNNLILTDISNGILTITLNRLDKKNALTSAMYASLCQHFADAEQNADIRCVVIQGNNECFCAGNDLQDFFDSQGDDELSAFNFVQALATFTKPLIVAVAGPAIGIGTTMLLHADVVLACDNAIFGLPFSKLGICPEAASSALLPQLIGHVKAFELLILGDTFDADTALSLNLMTKKVSQADLLASAQAYAKRIADLPYDSVMSARNLLKQANSEQVNNALMREKDTFARLVQTPDCKKILAHFLNKESKQRI